MDLSNLVLSLATEYYKWDCYIEGRCCVSPSPFILTAEDYAKITNIAVRFNDLIKRTIKMVFEESRLMRFFGFSKFEKRLLAIERGRQERYKSHIARYDFFRTYDGSWKIAEFNTDVPGGEPEAVGLSRLLHPDHKEYRNPAEGILAALKKELVGDSLSKTVAIIYATGYSEDLQVAQLVKNFLIKQGVPALLGNPANMQYVNNHAEMFGERIDVVYRYYPAEWLASLPEERLDAFLGAYSNGLFYQVNPFSQLICQNKKISAFWWKHFSLFTKEEKDLIRKYIPRTGKFVPEQRARYVEEQGRWVLKKSHGRMGEQVIIGDMTTEDEWKEAVAEIARYDAHEWTVQEFFRTAPIVHEGTRRYPCVGTYVIGDNVAGLYTRLSDTPLTTYHALNVATFVEQSSTENVNQGQRTKIKP